MAEDIGYGITVTDTTKEAARGEHHFTTSCSPNMRINWGPIQVKRFVKFVKEHGVEISNNDERAGGQADYLTVDSEKMAREIVAHNRGRGVDIALRILQELGHEFIPSEFLKYLRLSKVGDKLQPEVSVDSQSGREEPDPWARFG